MVATSFLPDGAMMLRKDASIAMGELDQQTFLDHEDEDLCLRLSRFGVVGYKTGVLAVHDRGQSLIASRGIAVAQARHLELPGVYVPLQHYERSVSISPLGESLAKFSSLRIMPARGRWNAERVKEMKTK